MSTSTGTQAVTTTETTIKEYTSSAERMVDFTVDLTIMASGDTYVFRVYRYLNSNWRKFAEDTFVDAQDIPVIYYAMMSGKTGIRLTAQKTAGTDRTFPWESCEVT